MNLPMARNIINAVMFQLTWLICVQGKSIWAVLVTLLALLLHWRYAVTNPREWQLWLAVFAVGFGVDTALIAGGVLQFADAALTPPLWLSCLWLVFATTLLHSLSFLQRSLLLAAGLGAIGGPLAYYAGTQFAGIGLGLVSSAGHGPWAALLVLAVCWSLVTPLLVWLARYLVSLQQRRQQTQEL